MTNVWIITVQPLCCVCWSLQLRWNLLTSVTETQQSCVALQGFTALSTTLSLKSLVLWGSWPRDMLQLQLQLLVLLSLLPVPAASSGAASDRSFSTSCWLLLSFINSTTLSAQIIIWFWSSPRFPRRPVLKQINISRQHGPDRQQGKLARLSAFKRFPFQRRFKEAREGYRDRWRATGEVRTF